MTKLAETLPNTPDVKNLIQCTIVIDDETDAKKAERKDLNIEVKGDGMDLKAFFI